MKPGLAACVVVTALLAHAPALGGSYTFDDHAVVERNPRLDVKGAGDLLALLQSNYWGEAGERTGERLFRPVPLLTYAAERALVGAPSARVSLAVNVVLHALASLAALALFAQIAGSARIALVGALVFAAHPLHAEAVAGVVGRAELLALLFGALALERHGRGSALAGLFFLLALGSKESAIAVIPIALVRDFLDRRWRMASLVSLAVALAAYIGLRAAALGSLVPEAGARTLGDMTFPQRVVVALAVYRDAWFATLLPLRGTAAHHPFPRNDLPSIVAAVAVQVAVVVAFVALARSTQRGHAIALALAGFELALAPVSNIIPIGVVFAERLLYAPSLWAALAVGAALGPLVRAFPARVLCAFAIGGLALLSASNDRAWHDDVTLWEATARRFPDEANAHFGLGQAYLARNDARALEHLERAVALFPDSMPVKPKATILLAVALRQKDRARSEELLRRATRLGPMNPEVWYWLARVRLEEGDDKEARAAAERAVALAPDRADARMLLGLALLRTGDPRAAIDELTRAIPGAQNPGEPLLNRAEAKWAAGDRDGALADYREAARLLPPEVGELRLVLRLAEAGLRDEARERWRPLRGRVRPDVQAKVDALLGA